MKEIVPVVLYRSHTIGRYSMKRMVNWTGIIAIGILFVTELVAVENTLTTNDLEYYQSQNTTFSQEMESYFDQVKPAYNSRERRYAFYLLDALLHYPSPHADCIKEMFLNRYQKALNSIRTTDVKTGSVVWNLYNMSYIVKTADITVAFDLIRLPECLRKVGNEDIYNKLAKDIVDLCDILFISHIHGDHADSFVAQEFLQQNKLVIANPEIFKNEPFYPQINHWPADGKGNTLLVPTTEAQIVLRVYPGHQAISAEAAVDNNITVVTFPNHITIAHSGDQSWKEDFTWIDTLHKEVAIDILLVNTWTLWPDQMMEGFRPVRILPGHINEMEHEIISRISYWKSYIFWQKGGDKVVHLFWGEPCLYEKNES